MQQTIRSRFEQEGFTPERWSNGPGAVYAVHAHLYAKVLMVAEGSIEFRLPEEGRTVRMKPGDRLDLPAQTAHGAVVGPNGVVCFEAHC